MLRGWRDQERYSPRTGRAAKRPAEKKKKKKKSSNCSASSRATANGRRRRPRRSPRARGEQAVGRLVAHHRGLELTQGPEDRWRRRPGLTGRNPSKTKRSAGRPAADSGPVATAKEPGTTGMPAARACLYQQHAWVGDRGRAGVNDQRHLYIRSTTSPLRELVAPKVARDRHVDQRVREQPALGPGVLAGDQVQGAGRRVLCSRSSPSACRRHRASPGSWATGHRVRERNARRHPVNTCPGGALPPALPGRRSEAEGDPWDWRTARPRSRRDSRGGLAVAPRPRSKKTGPRPSRPTAPRPRGAGQSASPAPPCFS